MRFTTKQRLLLLRYLLRATRDYASRAAKNCVRISIGRKTFWPDTDLFFRQYFWRIVGLRQTSKVTCTSLESEGPGSQALMIMDAIVFARWSGLVYVHTPFSSIRHADRPAREWADAWETTFNLGAGEIACDSKRHDVADFFYYFIMFFRYSQLELNGLEVQFGMQTGMNELALLYMDTVPEFRRRYYLNKSPITTPEVTVAVHVRRGYDMCENHDLFTSTETILRTVAAVKSTLSTHKVKHRIEVYSEGDTTDFAEICLPGVELRKYRVGHISETDPAVITNVPMPGAESFVDVDAIEAMRRLVEADVLIMAKSSFRYYAGLISDGIKIFEPPRAAMPDWIVRSSDGSFDVAEFERQLVILLQARDAALTRESAGIS